MTDNKPYQFKVLRYTHDIVSGEFLNAGVCLLTTDGEPILGKVNLDPARFKRAFPTLDEGNFVKQQEALQSLFDKASHNAMMGIREDVDVSARSVLFHIVNRKDDGSFSWGPASGILSPNPGVTLEHLYHRFVSRFE